MPPLHGLFQADRGEKRSRDPLASTHPQDARASDLQPPVAIKIIDREALSAKGKENMIQEIRLMQGFEHPNIVHMLEWHVCCLFGENG